MNECVFMSYSKMIPVQSVCQYLYESVTDHGLKRKFKNAQNNLYEQLLYIPTNIQTNKQTKKHNLHKLVKCVTKESITEELHRNQCYKNNPTFLFCTNDVKDVIMCRVQRVALN